MERTILTLGLKLQAFDIIATIANNYYCIANYFPLLFTLSVVCCPGPYCFTGVSIFSANIWLHLMLLHLQMILIYNYISINHKVPITILMLFIQNDVQFTGWQLCPTTFQFGSLISCLWYIHQRQKRGFFLNQISYM